MKAGLVSGGTAAEADRSVWALSSTSSDARPDAVQAAGRDLLSSGTAEDDLSAAPPE